MLAYLRRSSMTYRYARFVCRRSRVFALMRIWSERESSDAIRDNVMAPTIVQKALIASLRASGPDVPSARASKTLLRISEAAALVSWSARAISLPRAANGHMGVGASRWDVDR